MHNSTNIKKTVIIVYICNFTCLASLILGLPRVDAFWKHPSIDTYLVSGSVTPTLITSNYCSIYFDCFQSLCFKSLHKFNQLIFFILFEKLGSKFSWNTTHLQILSKNPLAWTPTSRLFWNFVDHQMTILNDFLMVFFSMFSSFQDAIGRPEHSFTMFKAPKPFKNLCAAHRILLEQAS